MKSNVVHAVVQNGLFPDLEPDASFDTFEKTGDLNLTGHPLPRVGYIPPFRGDNPLSGATRGGGFLDRSDRLTASIEAIALREFAPIIANENGGRLGAFAAVFARPDLMAQAIAAADAA